MLIGEVSRRSGVSVRMLRHYDRIGLVAPSARTGTGYREYSSPDVRRLFQVEALRTLGLSLVQAAAALDDPQFDAAEVLRELARETEDRVAREHALLARLHEIESTTPETWEDVLDVVGLLAALRSGGVRARQAAALRSGVGSSRIAWQLIEAYLDEAEPNAAGTLRWAIARAGEPAVAALAARTPDPEAAVRLRVVRALGDIGGRSAAEVLARYLTDADEQAAGRAALALGRLDRPGRDARSPDLVSRLTAMIVAGVEDVAAAETMGALASRSVDVERQVVEALATRLDMADAVGPAARSRLTQALGEIPGERAAATLRGLRADPEPAVARVADYLVARACGGGRTSRAR